MSNELYISYYSEKTESTMQDYRIEDLNYSLYILFPRIVFQSLYITHVLLHYEEYNKRYDFSPILEMVSEHFL